MARSIHLIICQYARDTSWADGLSATIVHNGVDRPNEGREPGAFFWWMHTNYKSIDPNQTYAFLQDNPFDHAPDTLNELREVAVFTPFTSTELNCGENGQPHHPGLPVRECYERWVGEWQGDVTFTVGGQFLVPGGELLKHKREEFKRMEAEMSVGEQAWVMERLWRYYFTR